jgi:dTDP-4-amino-4,6-dideoxygalactose transaminase
VRIPFNKPFITGKEVEYVSRVIASNEIAADGRFTLLCARLLQERFGIKRVLMTPSCTAALEMAALLSDLADGDEVIMPSFTFVSTANAVLRTGARPIFVDIRSDTLNIDETQIESAITTRTKAIYVVHYAGIGCEMDAIGSIGQRHELIVLEDAAQGVNAFYKGKPLGSLGMVGAYSFHHTKNYTCGEGGALCVNAAGLVERAEIIREKGTNRSRFLRGEVDKYTWVEVGSSHVPSEMTCAFLCAQLEMMDRITDRRRKIFDYYFDAFSSAEEKALLSRPLIPGHCVSNYHSFHVILPSPKQRDGAIKFLRECGIQAVFHYVPLHTSPMGVSLGYRAGELPVTENLSARLLRLPFFCDITESEQQEVVNQLVSFLERS